MAIQVQELPSEAHQPYLALQPRPRPKEEEKKKGKAKKKMKEKKEAEETYPGNLQETARAVPPPLI